MDDGITILKSEEDLISHEKLLYRNFYRNYPAYSRKFFTLVDKNRLKPNIPYRSQVICALKHAGMLNCVASFCVNPEEIFVVESMGFKIEKNVTTCEVLHFYSKFSETFNLEAYKKLFTFSITEMMKKNFRTMYSSCSEKFNKFYKVIGFDIVDSILFEGEKEFLIKYDIRDGFEQDFMNTSRIQL